MKVLFCASEVAPFAKTGGLADVTGSLPLALADLGAEVRIIMPRYRGVPAGSEKISANVTIYFIENEAYFNRSGLYGNGKGDYPDNLERFSFFCNRALDLAKELGFRPDIVHVHDWQTALIPVLLKTRLASDDFYKKAKTLLTIHNLAYQGQFPARLFSGLGLDQSLFSVEGFEFYGKINLLKAGLLFADGLNTVSPTYAGEIHTQEYGYGLEGVIQKRSAHLRGILNGIDYRDWNPAKDALIARPYSATDLAGKAACKRDLQKRCGFEKRAAVPLFGIVTRLAQQKGLDLLREAAGDFLSRDVQWALLGDGDGVYKTAFANLAKKQRRNFAAFLGFHAEEARHIYAGSDFFLMPSLFEPCGLGQMISLKYGTLPVVRKTGGLADTVLDADRHETGNGFVFDRPDRGEFLSAVDRAIRAFRDKKRMPALRKTAMKADFSWKKSANAYWQAYQEILKS